VICYSLVVLSFYFGNYHKFVYFLQMTIIWTGFIMNFEACFLIPSFSLSFNIFSCDAVVSFDLKMSFLYAYLSVFDFASFCNLAL
jgi:hypothetical protein